MMIPPFDDNGNLPLGIHLATLDEVDNSMREQSQRELIATREKLRLLEERYEAGKREDRGDEHVRELSMRSLKRFINQLKEEIARFESRRSLGTSGK